MIKIMDTQVLENMGMTKGEIKAYLALLELGSSTAGPIVNKSRVSPSKVYDILSRLIEKGIVSYIVKGKVKHFNAAAPERLLAFVEKRKEELDDNEAKIRELLPQLKLKQGKQEQKAEIFEGIRGIKTFFDMAYNECPKGGCVYAIGYPLQASKLFNAYFKEFHQKKLKHKISAKIAYNYDAWFAKKREKRELCEQRYLPKGISTPAWIYFFGDVVGIITVTEEQKICFMIKNKEVAESYMNYFNLIWKQAIRTGR